MSVLRIYFSSQWRDSASVCAWALCEESGAVVQTGSGTLASMPKGNECIGIVAPERTVFLDVNAPPGARRQWKTALSFLAEGQTLPDPEENHVVQCGVPEHGRVHLAVMDRAWMRRIVEACRASGLQLRRMLSETMLLPLAGAGWRLAWDGAGGFIRTGAHSGLALDTGDAGTPPVALRLLLDQPETRPDKITVNVMPGASGAAASLPSWANFPVPLAEGGQWDWRRADIPADASNLLAGELAPPSRPMEWWPKLRPAIYIVLALLLVEVVGYNLRWALLASEAKSLHHDMTLSFRKAFGNEAAIENAPLQMQRNIAGIKHAAGLETDSDFLPMMQAAANALSRLPRGSVREMHFADGKLQVMVQVPATPVLDTLLAGLRDAGLAVHAETQSAGKALGCKLTIRLPGAS